MSAIVQQQPKTALTAVENQKTRQWVNNEQFYTLVPAPYNSFYRQWVKHWLDWYDGYVPEIHGGQFGLLSTRIGTTIVNRAADSIFGGNLMFANARKPYLRIDRGGGKTIGAALDFVSNTWAKQVNFRSVAKRATRYALAGGFALLKLNKSRRDLWAEALRADRFFADIDGRGHIDKVVSILSFYETVTKGNNGKKYSMIEERRYERVGLFQMVPVVEYKICESTAPIQYLSISDTCVKWEDLPKEIKQALKRDYDCELNRPLALNGFKNLGCYILKGSDDVSSVPQIRLGESLLANVLTYLYEYDFYNTCFNTDMYLARGRVMIPKPMQSPQAAAGNAPGGLDDFVYTKYDSPNNDAQKPEAIQFALRSAEWKEARNILLESIATGIGMSVSTLASYLSDGSNRTAREVSAEESATTLFIENNRRRLETPFNEMLSDVLRFYGYVDDVEIRWSKAGMTNVTVLVDTLTKAIQGGLISKKKAHHAYNYDDDEEQNEEDYSLVEQEQAQQQNSFFGGE